jgi:hypothetical protein
MREDYESHPSDNPKYRWVIVNYNYDEIVGSAEIRDDGYVHIILRDPKIVEYVAYQQRVIGVSLTHKPAVEAKKDDEPEYRTWFSTPAGVFIILKNDHVVVDPQGQALVFYRKIDADRKLEEIKKEW